MFKDRGEYSRSSSSVHPDTHAAGDAGKACRLIANCFKIIMSPEGCITHYHYQITPAPKSPAEEKWVLQEVWPELTERLGTFVAQCPRHIFSPAYLDRDLQLGVREAHTVSVKLFQKYTPEQLNSGFLGETEVVFQHIVKKLSEALVYQRIGRRYFNNVDAMDGKAQLAIFGGFYAALNPLGRERGSGGPQLQLDIMNRAVHKRSVIESLGVDFPLALREPEVRAEWRRRCVSALVVTTYNSRAYRIRAVHFDKSPSDEFAHYQREEKRTSMITYQQYYGAYYSKEITELRQPLLEAVPEKESERIFLVPELCALTGFSDEMRKDKNLMNEALKQTKVSPQDRLSAIQKLAREMAQAGAEEDTGPSSSCAKFMQDWKVSLNSTPVEVDARMLDPLEVSFGAGKTFQIEDGNFQRWMRNGLQCPTSFDEWLFIYPESDVPVLDIWLRSLCDIAQVAFTMKMAEPQRIVCTEQRSTILQVLEERLKPTTQMVLLLTPQKDCRRVYQLFKRFTCKRYPCVTQVVKSETVRRRQSIAAILSRIVLQINAKFCGPLWHVELRCSLTSPLFASPTMVVGVDVYRSPEGEQYMGFAASLDTCCSEYYSTASALDGRSPGRSMSVKLQEHTRDALLHFARRNDGLLPEHVVVYRASVGPGEWAAVRATEVEAVRAVLRAAAAASGPEREAYTPALTFVAVSRRVGMRFFCGGPGQGSAKNPEPGTVVDSAVATRQDCASFYLVSQAVGKGTATPTHYTVLHDSASLHPNTLQNLSYRLSFLYYNHTGSVKMPAPAQYARKVAHLVGTAVRADPHRRLLCTFFYL